MKITLLTLLGGALLLSSCDKDPQSILPGTWTIEQDGGEVTFNEDGTGYSVGASDTYFSNIGCTSGDTVTFTWEANQTKRTKGTLLIDFDAIGTCDGSTEPRYKIWPGSSQISIGDFAVTDIFKKKD